MSVRRFTALGTASQVPNTKRNQHASFLTWDAEGFLFDPGEGTQRQMIYSGITATDITKIFITHFHGDHCLGLPSILQRLSLDKVKHTVDIYFPASGVQFFENIKGVSSYYDIALIEPHPIEEDGIVFEDDNMVIKAQLLDHTVDTFGYRFEEKDSVNLTQGKLKALGISGPLAGELKSQGKIVHNGETIRLEDVSTIRQGQTFAFVMDTRICDAAFSLAQGADLLVTESTFLSEDEDAADKYGHLTTAQAATIATESKAGTLLLTHFSQRYGPNADFACEARKVHPNTVQMNDKDTFLLERKKDNRVDLNSTIEGKNL